MTETFDVERVTRRFYEKFKTVRAVFLDRIEGIARADERAWYASLMLNRLMFLYFIQQKNFLDDDPCYLRRRLERRRARGVRRQADDPHEKASQAHAKHDTFYRCFLRPLFHEGLARESRTDALARLLGRVPYLGGGGLFDVHALERAYPRIEIDDDAFVRIFDFFDTYHWRLDDLPVTSEREINPDVLGYIFEKYVNQKQMGAYYTKEDITGYISKNAVITFLFDTVERACPASFQPDADAFSLLRQNPDRYIYADARRGVVRDGEIVALPSEIAAGLTDMRRREAWNRPAPPAFALPTETWREYLARRARCLSLRARLAAGELASLEDVVTHNLDIERFAADVIDACESPSLLRAFYRALERMSVLDPTCGSGAFLFAAMRVLAPLYEACLARMQAFSGEPDFRALLERAGSVGARRYFILKSIAARNLYGVDLMPEAVEICRLRLFLKLAAQVERDDGKPNQGLEPLPDIEFNIRSGNTLVGFVDEEEARAAFVAETRDAGGATRATPIEQRAQRFDSSHETLDRRLAGLYGVKADDEFEFARWREAHRPFHWHVEFPRIIERGGFDVVIGNPPYVEYSKTRAHYRVAPGRYRTEATGNLYALVLERARELLARGASLAMIVPQSAFCTQRMTPLIELVREMRGAKWAAHFGWRPATLFEGVNIPLSILLARPGARRQATYTTTFVKWYKEYRPALFSNLQFAETGDLPAFKHVIPKIGSSVERRILQKMFAKRRCLSDYRTPHAVRRLSPRHGGDAGTTMHLDGETTSLAPSPPCAATFHDATFREATSRQASLREATFHRASPPRVGAEQPCARLFYRNTGGLYWRIFTDFQPYFTQDGRRMSSSTEAVVTFDGQETLALAAGVLNSNLYWFFYVAFSSFHHVNAPDIFQFPIDFSEMDDAARAELLCASGLMLADLRRRSRIRQRVHRGGHVSRTQTFFPALSKPLVDDIDRLLARHYDFDPDELDFIINYDIKFRAAATHQPAILSD